MNKPLVITALALVACVTPRVHADNNTLLFIPDSHLDTQWNWDVVTTIDQYLKNTLNENLTLLDKYPNFRFNFEGAIRYKWMKEYYPAQYARLQSYIDAGRWNVSGCGVDANDVMVSSAESIMRNWLYGSVYYKTEFGVRGGHDIMLPDCFGFPYSLPSLAAHCGVTGFHTAKLGWGSAVYDQLPPFGIWQGVDGSQIYAVYKPHAYDSHEEYNKDMANDAGISAKIADNLSKYGVATEIRYVGPRSDHGGALQDKSGSDGENTPYWLNYSVGASGPVKVKLATPDEVFAHLDAHKNEKYHVYDGELPMRVHGVGAYTSQAVLKRWNRRNELLADAAEKASVAAEWLGAAAYPTEELRDAWVGNLWQAHHDGITGTSIPKAYIYSQNEYALANKAFGDAFTNSAGAFIAALDTRTQGVPIVLYNPLSFDRTDVAQASIGCSERPEGVRVFGPDGKEVLAQVADYDAVTATATIAFAATVPSLGYAVYDVRLGEQCTLTSELTLDSDTKQISNGKYRYSLDSKGDCNIYDLVNKRLIMGYPSLQMLDDTSNSWPAWEVTYETVAGKVVANVDENVTFAVAEDGPLRKVWRVDRTKSGSTFTHYIIVSALSARVDMVNEIDWRTRNTLLKLNMSVRSAGAEATYDLSLGTIRRGVRTSEHYEMQGHQWADLSSASGYGVSVINDCKYGWDMPQAGTLRLSLIHTPRADSYKHQQLQDLCEHRFTVAFFPHQGEWGAETQQQAAMVNQPLMAFEAPKHDGAMGKTFAMARLSTPEVAVKALKKAELSDEYIVRVYELTGNAHSGVTMQFPAEIISAREVNGLEEELPSAPAVNIAGATMTFDIGRYQPKTFAVRLAAAAAESVTALPASAHVALDYDTDIMSGHDAITDADRTIGLAFPADLMSDVLTADDITFAIGSRDKGQNNALSCHGQTLKLDRNAGSKLYLLALSTATNGTTADFRVGDQTTTLSVPCFGGYVGQAQTAYNFGAEYRRDEVAFAASHCHNAKTGKNETFAHLYIYKYMLPLPQGVDEVVLPDAAGLYIIAATVSDSNHDDAKAASEVYTYPGIESAANGVDFGVGRLVPDIISASGQTNSGEAATMASDGDPATKWCSTSSNSWVEYRFNDDVVVSRWALLNAAIEDEAMITRDFSVQYCENGSGTWKDISAITGNSSNYLSTPIEPVTGRRFRLLVRGGEQNGGSTARIYEFALYGHAKSESSIQDVAFAATDGISELRLEVFTPSGLLVKRTPLTGDPADVCATLAKGIYICRISGLQGNAKVTVETRKILVK